MTAFTTPDSVTAGDLSDADQWNTEVRANMLHLTEIQNWTPTVVQTATVSKTVRHGRYWMAGKRVWAQCDLAVTSAGTSGAVITVSLPVTAVSSLATSAFAVVGNGWIIDNSPTAGYEGAAILVSTTTVALRVGQFTGHVGTAGGGAAGAWALASGDTVSFNLCYEAA